MPDGGTEMAAPDGAQESPIAGNMAASSCSQKGFTSISTDESTGLFGLPLEIRLLIWEFLLPGRRVLAARPKHEDRIKNARLTFEGQPKQPVLSQICSESRNFVLRRGSFIFKKEHNGGFWWSAEDVFLVDKPCSLRRLSDSLVALDGLEMIRHVAVDSYQAGEIVWIRQEPRGAKTGTLPDSDDLEDTTIDRLTAFDEMTPVRWMLSWDRGRNCDRYKHPISLFLKHYTRLTVHFALPVHDHRNDGPSCDLLGGCSLTFDIPATNMNTGVRSIEEFHRMWTDLPVGVDRNEFMPRGWRSRSSTGEELRGVELCRSPSFRRSEELVSTLLKIPPPPMRLLDRDMERITWTCQGGYIVFNRARSL